MKIAFIGSGPAGRFAVNVPNQSQIDNFPRDAVVECIAEVDALGVRPLVVGALPPPARAGRAGDRSARARSRDGCAYA